MFNMIVSSASYFDGASNWIKVTLAFCTAKGCEGSRLHLHKREATSIVKSEVSMWTWHSLDTHLTTLATLEAYLCSGRLVTRLRNWLSASLAARLQSHRILLTLVLLNSKLYRRSDVEALRETVWQLFGWKSSTYPHDEVQSSYQHLASALAITGCRGWNQRWTVCELSATKSHVVDKQAKIIKHHQTSSSLSSVRPAQAFLTCYFNESFENEAKICKDDRRMYKLRAEIYLADELVGRFSITKQMAANSELSVETVETKSQQDDCSIGHT